MPNPASSYRSADPAEIDRNAYNAAFYELGLRWHWDIDTYNELQDNPVESDRVRVYLQTRQPHLLKAYDLEFLVNAIQLRKARCRAAMAASQSRRPCFFDWAQASAGEVGA
jgi:hypothetical protein